MDDFKSLTNRLINGTSDEIKAAKKEIKKITGHDPDWCKNNRDDYFAALDEFDLIKDDLHRTAFIDGTSVFFLCLGDDHFERLKDFTLYTLQSPSGYVREAIRKASDWLFVSLTARDSGKKAQIAAKQYVNYVRDLEALMEKYPDNSRTKYIDSMPPSVNKSLQMVWARLTESRAYQEILDLLAPEWLKRKREQISKLLERLIRKYNDDIWPDQGVDDIRRIIFDEENARDVSALLKIVNPSETGLKETLALCNEAWNYFPHSVLDGKCPMEMIQSYAKNNPGLPMNPDAPFWQEMNDAPNISLGWENGNLTLEKSDKNQLFGDKTFIGTGAGGKVEKLRFYFIFTPAFDLDFSKSIATRVGWALKLTGERLDCDIEQAEFEKDYALITVLAPFEIAPARFGDGIIKVLGKGKDKILKHHYFSGNVLKPGKKEISDYLEYLEMNNIK